MAINAIIKFLKIYDSASDKMQYVLAKEFVDRLLQIVLEQMIAVQKRIDREE